VVDDDDSRRTFALGANQRAYVEALWPAVDGVGSTVARAFAYFFGLYHVRDSPDSNGKLVAF
jgi:hypothetical protein